ncbi:MAG: flagellar basal body P-ring formation protein FlgA [Nitrosomonadales bacterium]|nr:flagellar basal body P-ring formation protein FlgA [Nitrosomonadales bacterium]
MKKLIALLFCLIATPVWADASQSHAEIRDRVTAFVQEQTQSMQGKVSIKVEEIDRRIALPACPALEVFLPTGARLNGKTSIGVRCNNSNGWSLYVPVQIKVSVTLLVSAKPLQQGQTLHAEDFVTQEGEMTQPGILTDPAQAIGKILKFGLGAGQVLKQDMLRAPNSVTQGQAVKILVKGNGFTIRSEGQALNNAAEGQSVQVKTASGQIISGMAREGGVVEVQP